MRLQPLPDPWNTGAEMNRHWRAQQARLTTTAQQKPAIDVHHDVIATEKQPVIHQDTPVKIPLDVIFTSSTIDTGSSRFLRFLKIYRAQLKAKQDKPIIVQKAGDNYLLIDGGRRLAAARLLKMPTIAAIVQEDR